MEAETNALRAALRGSRPPEPARTEPSVMRRNAEADPNYCPYCMRCPGLVRMQKVEPFFWRCRCGAEHDERLRGAAAPEPTPTAAPLCGAAVPGWLPGRRCALPQGHDPKYCHADLHPDSRWKHPAWAALRGAAPRPPSAPSPEPTDAACEAFDLHDEEVALAERTDGAEDVWMAVDWGAPTEKRERQIRALKRKLRHAYEVDGLRALGGTS